MQKYIFCFVLLLFSLDVVHSQPLHFGNGNENRYLQNPGFLGFLNQSLINIGIRNQWPSTAGYTTVNLGYIFSTADLPYRIGINIVSDQEGPALSQTMAQLNYSYDIRFSKKLKISAGIAGKLTRQSIDYPALNFENTAGIVPNEKNSSFKTDFNIGALAQYNSTHYFGVGFENIVGYTNKNTDYWSVHFDYIYRYTQQRGINTLELLPWTHFLISNYYQTAEYGVRAEYAWAIAGLSLAQDANFNFLYGRILLGTRWGNYQFIYLYDLNLSQNLIFHQGINAHEVTFSVFLRYKSNRRKMKAIKCPTF